MLNKLNTNLFKLFPQNVLDISKQSGKLLLYEKPHPLQVRAALRLAIGREVDRMAWDAKRLTPRHKALVRLMKKASEKAS
jgi:hypothetical protein